MDRTFLVHEGGKIGIYNKVIVKVREDLSRVYTPGVARVCLDINKNKEHVYRYTIKGNTVAVITDGTAVLGLGNIGPDAAMPVMEGKCMLFKEFGGVDAFPIALRTTDVDEIVSIVKKSQLLLVESILKTLQLPAVLKSNRSSDRSLTFLLSTMTSMEQQ